MGPPAWHWEQKATVEAAADSGLLSGHLVTNRLAWVGLSEAGERKPRGVLEHSPKRAPPRAT